ncbi:DJ-1/PfpI family protein [Leptospira wolffii]|nr:DJ-1/PfpI family protein [Leptospira wolffii]TGK62425.1 DJ-1/PfpI family protein [Leptospira wolffii]TGK70635.1 DJ-1/PfpI family protein [Leptospira wolffii]TGK74191.1 DJ-1/PfpI family protein [Leptospira wolffii]TGL32234.1 DJ-1/PfpI family protein [Leptospira wolffii]
MSEKFRIGMILFPDLTQLDLTGPYEVFSRMPDSEILLLAETKEAVRSEKGLSILPDRTWEGVSDLDLVFVPGGIGVNPMMENENLLSWIRARSKSCKYMTSVCTGSLVLAAAGVLDGYKATTHWLSLPVLELFPEIEISTDRVVIDRNRITGGGITAGIDFALRVVSEIRGSEAAQEIQLMMEYNPDPPFRSGHPSVSPPSLVDKIRESRKKAQDLRMEIAKRAISDRRK